VTSPATFGFASSLVPRPFVVLVVPSSPAKKLGPRSMPRSHPPTLITRARAALQEPGVLPHGAIVLVAVSGGPDSMALLHVLARLRSHRGMGLFAHGVDHGLRREASTELDRAERFADSLEVPFGRSRLRVAPGSNLQARARKARWDALEEAASRAGAVRIATGHHADDRAETLLMRLLRGTGARGLGVLPVRDSERIRPFIRARRVDIEAHIARHGIPFSDDPSNRDPRFLRGRVRREVLPVLEHLGPRIVEHLCRIADELSEAPAAKPAPPVPGLGLGPGFGPENTSRRRRSTP
jgi:tRNA(Ile)-lysidine synthase